ncbi:MAG: hypothetical protein [Arizlama microvirus]|nr:MAG: hypothetical protein [Arizlama microvirus]
MEKNKTIKGLPNRPIKSVPESYEGDRAKTMTERIGYTPFSKRMTAVQLAGENLMQYRAQQNLFDATGKLDIEDIDWDSVNVRSLGFGLSEYAEYSKAVAKRKAILYDRIKSKKAEAQQQDELSKKTSEAQKASGGGTPAVGSGLTGPGGLQGAAHAPAS